MLQNFKKGVAFCKIYVRIGHVKKKRGSRESGRTWFMKRKIGLLLTVLFVMSMAVFMPVKAEAAGKVGLNTTKVLLEVGQSYQLTMNNATGNVKWSTADKKVVKVDKNGMLTPQAVGSAKVTAKVNGEKYTCKVTVADYSGMSMEQKEVVSYALQYVGNKYRYGGSSLTDGTDCSGFTMAVYKKFGYDLVHNAYKQLKETKSVKMKNIQPGDLIFYGSSKANCSHVALYIGNNKVVHASTETTGIVISDYQYRKYVGVGRVLKKATYPGEEVNEDVNRMAEAQ